MSGKKTGNSITSSTTDEQQQQQQHNHITLHYTTPTPFRHCSFTKNGFRPFTKIEFRFPLIDKFFAPEILGGRAHARE